MVSLRMGRVELNIKSIKSMLLFYCDAVGLEILKSGKNKVMLGHGKREIFSLAETNLPKAPAQDAGLFHVAIVHSSQAALAKTIKNVFRTFEGSFTGPADHLVSEAFYFTDPEGNGLELYYDRPRELWQWATSAIPRLPWLLKPGTIFISQLHRSNGLCGSRCRNQVSTSHCCVH